MPRPLRLGRTRGATSRMIAMVPSSSGTPAKPYSKKPKGRSPPFTAASDTRTLTGVPVSASSEPAWPANTMGIKSCDGGRLSRTAITTTTGSRAATEPLRLMSAVRIAISSIIRTSRRVRLSPAWRIRNCPVQAVTPVASRPALTTNSEAMKMTAGSPKPAKDCPRSSTPVAQSASEVASATTITGRRSQTNSTTTPATMVKVSAMSLKILVPRPFQCSRSPRPVQSGQSMGKSDCETVRGGDRLWLAAGWTALEGDAQQQHRQNDHQHHAYQRQDEPDIPIEADLGQRQAGDQDGVDRQEATPPSRGRVPGGDHHSAIYAGEVAQGGQHRHGQRHFGRSAADQKRKWQ